MVCQWETGEPSQRLIPAKHPDFCVVSDEENTENLPLDSTYVWSENIDYSLHIIIIFKINNYITYSTHAHIYHVSLLQRQKRLLFMFRIGKENVADNNIKIYEIPYLLLDWNHTNMSGNIFYTFHASYTHGNYLRWPSAKQLHNQHHSQLKYCVCFNYPCTLPIVLILLLSTWLLHDESFCALWYFLCYMMFHKCCTWHSGMLWQQLALVICLIRPCKILLKRHWICLW